MDVNDLEWDDIESDFRKYRDSLDGIQTISSYTFYLKNNENSPLKQTITNQLKTEI